MKKLLYVFLTMTVVFAMVACGGGNSSPGGGGASGEKTLLNLTIGGIEPDPLPTNPDRGKIPAAISADDWADVSGTPYLPSGGFGLSQTEMDEGPIEATVSGGGVAYAIGYSDTARALLSWGSLTFPLTDGSFLYVRVTAENNSVNYYKFSIANTETNANIREILVNDKSLGSGGFEAEDTDTIDWATHEMSRAEAINAVFKVIPMTSLATVRLAQVADGSTLTAGDWEDYVSATGNTFTFDDNDSLYIEVTSKDTTNTLYYGVKFEVGRNAKLATIGIETPYGDELRLGTPAVLYGDVEPGNILTDRQPNTGIGIYIETQDSEAGIEYAFVKAANQADPAPAGTLPSLTPYNKATGVARTVYDTDDVYYLYIEVTAYAGNKLYYVTKVTFPAKGKLYYGNPRLTNPDGSFYYDATFWNNSDLPTFSINRVNLGEGAAVLDYMKESWGLHTSAEAKAAWNDDGIYVYVNVTTKQYRETAGGPLLNRPLASHDDDGYQGDSFEVFVNERLQYIVDNDVKPSPVTVATQDVGNQYRVGIKANTRSGRPAGQGTTPNSVSNTAAAVYDDFVANGISAVKRTGAKSTGVGQNGDATNAAGGGYEIVVFVPFSEQNHADANKVYEAAPLGGKQIKALSEIGFELQINTGVTNGTRDGILTWNGVTNASYQNAAGYGQVDMILGTATRIVNVEKPEITTQPEGEVYDLNDTSVVPLTVVATTPTQTGTTLSYQWYKSATADGAGTPIPSATAASYTPPVNVKEAWYYYVVVTTNAGNAGVTGEQTRSVTSSRALVDVGFEAPVGWVDKVRANSNSVPVYGFNLPSGKTFGDYSHAMFKVKFDPYSEKKTGRKRAFGNFAFSTFNATTHRTDIRNAHPGGLLLNNGDGNETYDDTDWTDVVVEFKTRDTLTDATIVNAANGIIALGLGIFTNNDGGQRVYYVKDIKLTNGTDDEVPGYTELSAMYPAHPKLAPITSAAYASDSTNNTVIRDLFDDEASIAYDVQTPAAPADATTPFVVDLSYSGVVKNPAKWDSNYNNGLVFQLKDSTGAFIDVVSAKYTTLTITLNFYDGDDEPTDNPGNGILQAKFFRAVPANVNGANVGGQIDNFASSATGNGDGSYTVTVSVPANLHFDGINPNFTPGTLSAFGIQTGAGTPKTVQYIEVLSITLE